MSQDRTKKRPRQAPAPVRRGTALGLALWFGIGLLSAVPLNFLWGAVRGGGPAPSGALADPKTPSAADSAVFREFIQRGFDLISSERHPEAFDEFQRAAALAPSSPEPYLGLAAVYRKLQRHDQAEQTYRKAIQLDATCWPAKEELVKILCDLGRHDEAIAFLKDLERDMPNAAFVWGERALIALRTGKPREAIPLLEKYTRAEATQVWGFAHLGRAYADSGDTEKAEAALRQAIALDPKMGLAQLWLGQVLIALGRKAEGEEHLKVFRQLEGLATQAHRLVQLINREPDNVKALVQLAHIRGLLGRYQAALVPLGRAMELAPGDERLLQMRESLMKMIEPSATKGPADPSVPDRKPSP